MNHLKFFDSFNEDSIVSENILDRLKYGFSIIGSPYVWWVGENISSESPFWASDSVPPNSKYVLKNGCNCAGLVNLILRDNGIEIPSGLDAKWRGGVKSYVDFFRKDLVKFDSNKKYPIGSLLLRDFRSVDDQGHLAIIISNDKLLQSYPEGGVSDQISIEDSHNGFYYEYVVMSNIWLQNEIN